MHSVYALEGALGGTDASKTPAAKTTAVNVDVVARTAEGSQGVDQGSVRYTEKDQGGECGWI